MASKNRDNYLLFLSKIITLCIFFSGSLIYAKIAAGAPSNALETNPEINQADDSSTPAPKVNVARIQSAAQKTAQEDAMQNKEGSTTPPPPPVAKMKRGKKLVIEDASAKNEMRQVRGNSAIQSEDSLSSDSSSSGKSHKGKSSANKGDSF